MKLHLNLSKPEYEAFTNYKNVVAKDFDEEQFVKALIGIGMKYFVEETVRQHNENMKDPEYVKALGFEPSGTSIESTSPVSG